MGAWAVGAHLAAPARPLPELLTEGSVSEQRGSVQRPLRSTSVAACSGPYFPVWMRVWLRGVGEPAGLLVGGVFTITLPILHARIKLALMVACHLSAAAAAVMLGRGLLV